MTDDIRFHCGPYRRESGGIFIFELLSLSWKSERFDAFEAAKPSATRSVGMSAISVTTTNSGPIRAPAAELTINIEVFPSGERYHVIDLPPSNAEFPGIHLPRRISNFLKALALAEEHPILA
jgi:hypothetical protein